LAEPSNFSLSPLFLLYRKFLGSAKMETTFLTVVCQKEDVKIVTETLAQENFNNFTIEKKGDSYIFDLHGPEEEITRVSCSLTSLRNSFPVQIELKDEDGFVR
jgi:hypothetical protein